MINIDLPYSLFPPLPEQTVSRAPHCPICGEEAETFYIDRWGMTVGCGFCISAKRKKPSPSAAPDKASPESRRRSAKGGGHRDETGLFL